VRRKFKCDVCEKKAAVMECVTCVVKYCEACLETCHPKERAGNNTLAHMYTHIHIYTHVHIYTHASQRPPS
jgi:hypothetical protein